MHDIYDICMYGSNPAKLFLYFYFTENLNNSFNNLLILFKCICLNILNCFLSDAKKLLLHFSLKIEENSPFSSPRHNDQPSKLKKNAGHNQTKLTNDKVKSTFNHVFSSCYVSNFFLIKLFITFKVYREQNRNKRA